MGYERLILWRLVISSAQLKCSILQMNVSTRLLVATYCDPSTEPLVSSFELSFIHFSANLAAPDHPIPSYHLEKAFTPLRFYYVLVRSHAS